MALFGKGKQNTQERSKPAQQKAGAKEASGVSAAALQENYARIIRRPYITEKAAHQAENNAYTFEIAPDANKKEVKKAIHMIYDVTPRRVNIVRIPSRTVTNRRGQSGTKRGVKKAIVYVRKGERIEFV